ncbi:MAG: hypothetical protein MJ117_00475 [Lachnospiraceae bacterium]|nr:hypothetical protein [Lachnospiraceae bacterium]
MRSAFYMRLNYELTDRKLRAASRRLVCRYLKNDEPLSVRRVAEEAGVSLSTAYKHSCQDMIRSILDELDDGTEAKD